MVGQIHIFLLAAAMALLAACSSAPPRTATIPPPASTPIGAHSAVVDVARSLIGVPYRFGGASPRGMDCSGLVHYAYRKIGVTVPRTVATQRRHAFPVSLAELQAGDLLFFRLRGRRVSHVGIYIGDQQFVHAPRTGKRVSITRLSNEYWKKRLAGAGRFY